MQQSYLLGIIGHPLSHSLSPLVHNWALKQAKIHGVYLSWDIPTERLTKFVEALRLLSVHGLSVTIPHKVAIGSLLDQIDPLAEQAGAINTLYWQQGRLHGTNTDIQGFLAPLLGMDRPPGSALLLGNGGAARACLAGLRQIGTPALVCGRDLKRSTNLANEFQAETLAWEDRSRVRAELLINATPLGMHGTWQENSPLGPNPDLSRFKLVYDLVYRPLRTRLLAQAEAQRVATISGLEMFIQQAAAQFRLWTAFDLNVASAKRLCLQSLT